MSVLSKIVSFVMGDRSPRLDGAPTIGVDWAWDKRDLLSAAEDVAALAKDRQELVELFMALGNLYRAQGELDRAVRVRKALIARRDLAESYKAKAWFELGRDYRKLGLVDSAKEALAKARCILGDEVPVMREQAGAMAAAGEYEEAAYLYGKIKDNLSYAHYMALDAKRLAGSDDSAAKKRLSKAFKAFPGSAEAWLVKLGPLMTAAGLKKFTEGAAAALAAIPQAQRWMLPEGLLNPTRALEADPPLPELTAPCSVRFAAAKQTLIPEEHEAQTLRALLAAVDAAPAETALVFYAGEIAQRLGETEEAERRWEKALVLDPDFLPARKKLVRVSMDQESVSGGFRNRLEKLLCEADRAGRFVCSVCGQGMPELFFICPRCRHRHTASPRGRLS